MTLRSMRDFIKKNPHTDKESYREKIITAAIDRVKSERERNILNLRNRQWDYSGLAREILSVALSNELSSAKSVSSSSSQGASEPFETEIEDQLGYNEAAQIEFLGSEEHQDLMDQIAEALLAEYNDDVSEMDVSLYEDGELGEGFDWQQRETELSEETTIICPVCRVSQMEVAGSTCKCTCGTTLILKDRVNGEEISVGDLKDRLAIIYDRHMSACDYDFKMLLSPDEPPSEEDSDEQYSTVIMCVPHPTRHGACLKAQCVFCGLDDVIL